MYFGAKFIERLERSQRYISQRPSLQFFQHSSSSLRLNPPFKLLPTQCLPLLFYFPRQRSLCTLLRRLHFLVFSQCATGLSPFLAVPPKMRRSLLASPFSTTGSRISVLLSTAPTMRQVMHGTSPLWKAVSTLLSRTSWYSLFSGSVYITNSNAESSAVKEAVQALMGCAAVDKGKVNGLTTLSDGSGVCIGGNDGCGE